MWPFKPRPASPTPPADHDAIRVEFFDHATGQCFAQTDLPLDRLPESFEANTTMHLGDQDWNVIEARPMTATEFRRTGTLILIMRMAPPVTLIDPSAILFSLPTITNDALPPIAPGSSKLGADVIEIHEDDWRQIEWVSGSAREAIASELDLIRLIYDQEREASGFRRVHLRQLIPAPLADRQLRLEDLRHALGPHATWLAGFAYRGVAGIANASFAVRVISSIELYGVAPNGIVETLCFANTSTNNLPLPDVEILARLAATHDLLLADWCAAAVIPPLAQEYIEYFIRT
ncbi:MAG: hypothetical protein JWN40_4139 [Phycisphaerales bacterium]|nr:hypothetical protein [Phycisphaerales bacterium]